MSVNIKLPQIHTTMSSSPQINLASKSQRPSYLDINVTATAPINRDPFNEDVIRRLDADFDDAAVGEPVLVFGNEPIIEEDEEEEGEQIKTYLRIRPYMKTSPDELDLLEIKNNTTVIAHCGVAGVNVNKLKKNMEFSFTRVMDASYTQEQVFDETISPLLDRFDRGENCLIFSYGATNSGKTYTMRGSASKYGIIPRTLYSIFDRHQDRVYQGGDVQPFRHESTRSLHPTQLKEILERKKVLIASADDSLEMKFRSQGLPSHHRTSDVSSHCEPVNCVSVGASPMPLIAHGINDSVADRSIYGMWVSFVELYNEKCYDLLSVGRRSEVKIVSEKGGSAYFKDLTQLPVYSEEEAFALYVAGHKKLAVSATQVNQVSSRSHSFFTIRVVELGRAGQSVFPIKVHRITFCDLAGCERVNQTENTGGQLRESANINQSLLSLLRVIRMIRSKQSKGRDFLDSIPFRASKLTRIFQGYFTTSTHIAMLVNVNPAPKMADSSLHTLVNSAIASNVVAFRPKQTTQLVVKNNDFSSSFLHSSLDLDDLIEQTEDEDEENQPPVPVQPEIQIARRVAPISTASIIHNPGNILKPQNRICRSPVPSRKPADNFLNKYPNLNHTSASFNDFKMPKPFRRGNHSEAEYQALLCENNNLKVRNKELQNNLAHLDTEIMLRDTALEHMHTKLRRVEVQTREDTLNQAKNMVKDLRNFGEERHQKQLAWSDKRCQELQSRIETFERKRESTSTQTDASSTSVHTIGTQTMNNLH